MADYYPLIARAVAGLPQNTDEARRALYNRARNALIAQLRGRTPTLKESEIIRECRALDDAIGKVETEAFGNQKQPEQKQSEQTQLEPKNYAPPAQPTTPGKMSDKIAQGVPEPAPSRGANSASVGSRLRAIFRRRNVVPLVFVIILGPYLAGQALISFVGLWSYPFISLRVSAIYALVAISQIIIFRVSARLWPI